MAAKANTADLAAAGSKGLAQILAVAIVTGANTINTVGNPINKAIQEAVVLHAHELLALHDLNPEAVLAGLNSGSETGGNFANGQLAYSDNDN